MRESYPSMKDKLEFSVVIAFVFFALMLTMSTGASAYIGNLFFNNIIVVVPPVEEEPSGPPMIEDGRLNAYDIAAPVALYGSDNIDIYAIGTDGEGNKILRVTAEEIAAAGVPVDGPVVIAETINPVTGATITLYRLPSGEFQLNTLDADGNLYVFMW